MSDEQLSGEELVQNFMDNERLYCLEGNQGLEALNKLTETLGYTNEQYHQGSALENFLRDNSGACQALVNWIAEWTDKNKDWQDALYLEPEVEEDELTEGMNVLADHAKELSKEN